MKLKPLMQKYSYALWALYLPLYLAAFFFCERVITPDTAYFVSYLPIDDHVPFVAPFVIAYYVWFPYLVLTGLYLLFKSPDGFRCYMGSIAVGFTISVIVFLAFPNGQNLRPAAFHEDNVFTRLIGAIYAVDTNTNVLPSVHVLGAMAVVFAFFRAEDDRKLMKNKFLRAVVLILCVLINLSTVFIKQHSVLDLLAGFFVSGIMYVVVYVLALPAMRRRRERARAA